MEIKEKIPLIKRIADKNNLIHTSQTLNAIILAVSVIFGSLVFPYLMNQNELKIKAARDKQEALNRFSYSVSTTLSLHRAVQEYRCGFINQVNAFEGGSKIKDKEIKAKYSTEFFIIYNQFYEKLVTNDVPFESACTGILMNFSDENIKVKLKSFREDMNSLILDECACGKNMACDPEGEYVKHFNRVNGNYYEIIDKISENF